MPKAPLGVGACGDEVVRLHKFLIQQGYHIPSSEANRSLFGPSTRQAVLQYQKKNGLSLSGAIDTQTASKISAAATSQTNSGRGQTKPAADHASRKASSDSAQPGRVPPRPAKPRTKSAGKPDASPFTLSEASGRAGEALAADRRAFFVFADANPAGSVLDNLTKGTEAVKAALSATLNAALERCLAAGLEQGAYPVLSGLVPKIGPVDIAANRRAVLQAFLKAQAADLVANDAAKKQAAAAEAAKIPGKATVGDLLQLDASLRNHPLFRTDLMKASIASLLGTSPILKQDQQLQADFIERWVASHKSNLAKFWNQIRAEAKFQAAMPELRLTMQMASVTGNNAALMQAARMQFRLAKPSDLTKLTAADWEALLRATSSGAAAGIPSTIKGKTREERLANYVESIANQVKKAFATVYIGQAIAAQPQFDVGLVKSLLQANPGLNPRKRLPAKVNWNGTAPEAAKAAWSAFRQEMRAFPALERLSLLSANTPSNPVRALVGGIIAKSDDLDISTATIDAQHIPALAQMPAALREPVAEQLRSLKRLSRLSRSYCDIYALQSAGIHSASGVARMSQGTFLNAFAQVLGGKAKAQAVYSRALNVYSHLVNLRMRVNEALRGPHFGVFGDVAGDTARVLDKFMALASEGATGSSSIPSLTTLFGNQSSCQCQECQAMDGPAAYFVDIMNFLQGSDAGSLSPVSQALFDRRPDLWYLKLNCENTNTELPYIDLVNEIMESYVLYNGLSWRTAHNTPADATTEQLRLNPEYTNDQAYQSLLSAVYPPTLPFDLNLETVRTYLGGLGTTRTALMRTFRHGNIPTDLAIACEYLKISCNSYTLGLASYGAASAIGGALQSYCTIPIAYDYANARLTFCGVMTATQQSIIAALSTDPNFNAAVQFLFQMGSQIEAQLTNPQSNPVYTVPLANLPTTQSPLASPVAITVSNGNASFTGTMSAAQRSVLLGGSTDANYQSVVNSLFQFSQHAASGTYSLGFQTPPALPSSVPAWLPIAFSSAQAVFTGTMTAGQQAELLSLSPDMQYGSVINQLYQMSSQASLGVFTVAVNTVTAASTISLPTNLIPIWYSSSNGGVLSFTGAMTAAQRAVLLGLSDDVNYEAAVNNLFLMGSPSATGLLTVPLSALPEGVVLPEQLAAQVAYDTVNQRLNLTGQLSADQCRTIGSLAQWAWPTAETVSGPVGTLGRFGSDSIKPAAHSRAAPSLSAQHVQGPISAQPATRRSLPDLTATAHGTLCIIPTPIPDFFGPYSRLMEALYNLGANSAPSDLDILTVPRIVPVPPFYGVGECGPWPCQVEAFLAATGIAYTDLVALLETRFLNPSQAITLSQDGTTAAQVTSASGTTTAASVPSTGRQTTRLSAPWTTTLTIVSGSPQTVIAGTAFAPLIVMLASESNPISHATINFAVTSGQATLNAMSAATDASGQASMLVTASAIAQIVVKASIPGSIVPPVYFYLTVSPPALQASPNGLTFNYQIGGGNASPQTINVTSSAAPGMQLEFTTGATTNSGGSWLQVSPGLTTPGTLTVSVVIGSLTAGTYTGNVVITSMPPDSQLMIPVTLAVSSLPNITTSPSSLSFTYTLGGTVPGSQTESIGSSGSALGGLNASTTTPWLTVVSLSSTGTPSTLTIAINSSNLPTAAGQYGGSVTISATGAGNSPLTYPVSLTVSPAPTLSVTPASLSFTGQAGGPNPSAQALSVTSANGAVGFTVASSTTTGGPWLSVSPTSGTTNTTPTVSVNIGGLSGGTYTGSIMVTSATAGTTGSPVTIPVSLTLSSNTLSSTPSSLSFSYQIGGAAPASQSISISSTTSGLSFTATPGSGSSWLAVSPTSGNTPATLGVSVNPAGLGAGTYTSAISLSGSGASDSAVTITLNVTAAQVATDPCDLGNTSISGQPADLNVFFDGAYLFIRLWKKMGWTIAELDLALSLFNQGGITPDVILRLAQIKQIQQALNLAVDQTLAFWGDINTSGRQSLYMRLFQNPAVLKPVDPAFALTYYPAGTFQALPNLQYKFQATSDSIAYASGALTIPSAISGDELSQVCAVLPTLNPCSSTGQSGQISGNISYDLPNPYSFPDSQANSIYFGVPPGVQSSTSSQTLVFTGLMTDAEYAILKALADDSAYQLAIDNLYNLAWLSGVEMVSSPTPTVTAHQSVVLAALRISTTDLAALMASPMAVPDVLSLDNLSALYRMATLAKSLSLTIPDFLTFITLTGIDPFEDQQSTLRFIELAQYVANSNFSIQQLSYIYANVTTATGGLAPPMASLFQLLQGLQSGLQQIIQTYAPQPDPKGTRLKQALASLLPANLASQALGLANGTQVYSVPYALSYLPAAVAAYLSVPLTFTPSPAASSQPGQLVLACNPSPSQQAALLTSASSDQRYTTALNTLFGMAAQAVAASGTYSVQLPPSSVPGSISQTRNAIPVSYAGGPLTFAGSLTAPNTAMTSAQQVALTGVSADEKFQTAVNALYANSQTGSGPWSVLLPSLNLPPGTSLSDNPILLSYSGQLMFSGSITTSNTAMTTAQQLVLLGMSTDSFFQNAINALFADSQMGSGPWSVPLDSSHVPEPLLSGNNPNPILISYAGGPLTFPGSSSMTNAQLAVLLDMSPDSSYQATVNTLFAGSSSTPLPLLNLPPGTSLFNNPILISWANGQLVFSGSVTAPNTAMTFAQQMVLWSMGDSTGTFQAAVQILFTSSQSGTGPWSTPLASLNLSPGYSLSGPGSNPIPISYSGQLTFSGSATAPNSPMTDAQHAVLLSMSSDQLFQAAVNALYTSSQSGTWTVDLASFTLPAGISLSSNPIAINYANGLLTFSGVFTTPPMTAAQQAVLLGMSPDASFQAAVKALFTSSQTGTGPWWVPLASLNLPTGTTLNDQIPITYAAGQLQFTNTPTSASPNGAMTGAQMSVLLGLSQDPNWQMAVNNLYAMSTNTPLYSAPLSALPALLALPGDLPLTVTLSPPLQMQFVGPMSTAAQATLSNLDATADPDFITAIGTLYAQPRTFIAQTLVPAMDGFLSLVDALTNLIEEPSLAPPGFLLQAALGALQQTASYNLILQTLSSALSLDSPTLSYLLLQVLPSLVGGSNGFSGSYTVAGSTPFQETDPSIDFQWGYEPPFAPGSTPSTAGPVPFTVTWNGSVVVPFTDAFSFSVQADSQSTFQLTINGLPAVDGAPGVSGPILLQQFAVCSIQLTYSYTPTSGSPVPAQVVLKWSSLTMPEWCLVLPQNSMMEDFLAMGSMGFAATYQSQSGQAVVQVMKRADAEIDFQWGSQTPDPSLTGPAFFAVWLASVIAPFSEPYTFTVQADPSSTINLTVNGTQVLPAQSSTGVSTAPVTPGLYTSAPIVPVQESNFAIQLTYSTPGPAPSPANTSPQVSLSWSSPSMPQNLISPPASVAVQDLQLLYRIASLLTTLGTKVSDVQYLQQNGSNFAGYSPDGTAVPFNLTALPSQPSAYTSPWFDQWRRLNALFTLKTGLPASNVNLFQVFATASQSSDFYGTISPVLVAGTGWNADQVNYLYGEMGLSPADFVNQQPLLILQRCLALSAQSGVSCVKLYEWATIPPDTDPTQAQDIKNAVKAKYDDDGWASVGTPLADRMRDLQRNALVAYILTLSSIPPWVTDANTLYEYFLIDVEMAPCMLTSRIVQATAAVQLFVQRCLMNLESGISPTQLDAAYWSWMQNYRVWQANREVFLYPENYLVPTLRDDMTPPFQDLMNALLQNPVTNDNVTQAYANYLNALNDVSQLEIVGTFWQQHAIDLQSVGATTAANNTNTGFINVLHVFGRNNSTPSQYYYRQLASSSDPRTDPLLLAPAGWTPWQPLNLNISADHLIPVVWNGRLFLFWPTFNESTDPSTQTVTATGTSAASSTAPMPSMKQLQVSLNWSEYKQGAWVAPQTTPDAWTVIPFGFNAYPAGSYSNWSAFAFDSSLTIDSSLTTASSPGTPGMVFIRIDFTGSGTGPNVLEDPGFTSLQPAAGTLPYSTSPGWVESGDAIFQPFNKSGAGYGSDTGVVIAPDLFVADSWPNVSSELHSAAQGQWWEASIWGINGGPPAWFNNLNPLYNFIPMDLDQSGIVKVQFLDVNQNALPSQSSTFLNPDDQPGQWCYGSVPPAQAPPGTAYVILQALVTAGTSGPSSGASPSSGTGLGGSAIGSVTFSGPALAQALPETIGQFQFLGFPGRITSEGGPSYTPPPGSAAPSIPPGTTFNYMNLVGEGALTFEVGVLLSGSSLYTPSYQMMFPQDRLFNGQVNYETLPFFFSDQQRTYFVTPQSYTQTPAGLSLNETFQNHWHPFAGVFLQAFNWGSVPALLTLASQTLSNDGGVLAGLQLSLDNASGIVTLSPGVLVAQGQVFVFPPETSTITFTLSLPPWNLYFTSVGTPGLYWAPSPQYPGDAFIGSLAFRGLFGFGPITPFTNTAFQNYYAPNTIVQPPYPLENVDFSAGGAYSIYNWELFFHIPLLVATQLSTNQQFNDAMTWLQYIFNPTASSPAPVPQCYWNVLPFATDTEPQRIQDLLQLLWVSQIDQDSQQAIEYTALTKQIAASNNDPFEPFAIARLRPIAFMKKTVMAYLDNLIAWGDYLFSQDTRESINEATQLYVLADQILGPRPQTIPSPEVSQDLTFNDIQFQLDLTANAWVQMEDFFPFSSDATSQSSPPTTGAGVPSPGNFYFCIPSNTQLLGYWDTVADRLYKIRHCQNIAGQPQQLALFAPPINPALLVEAAALGVDIATVIASMSAPAPNYRFTYMLQKALELCSEVRSLGGALLSAWEKNDAEALALLRASQETSVLQAVLTLKQIQVNEANANYAGAQAAQAVASYRQSYYQGLIAAGLSAFETGQVAALTAAQVMKVVSQVAQLSAAGASQIPTVNTGAAGISSPVALISEGGSNISQGISYGAQALNLFADVLSYVATMCSISGQWDRRSQEWGFQWQSATLELSQIAQQIAAANFRVQIANQDYQNQQLQISNSRAIQNFLNSKFTNQQLYSWMISQISGVYFQCYQMAYGLAQRAEQCFQFELGLTTSNYVQAGYWDSLHKGLLAGESLYSDLKKMEIAYLDLNVREYEITKAVSLVLLDPVALITLKETGICLISLPEQLFDIDYPGHYMRRLKSVSLTIPCVAGPYTSINSTLTLVTNKIRWDPTAPTKPSNYTENPPNDARFMYDLAATQSIATSSAQNDSGMFEVNFRDERYLPFEGRGAISQWQFELPLDCNALDFDTITDVVLNLRYTSRNGGTALRQAAAMMAQLPAAPAQTGVASGGTAFLAQTNLARFFSLRHEFPTEWYRLFTPTSSAASSAGGQSMTVALWMDRFPYQYRGKKIQIGSIAVALKFKDTFPPELGLNYPPLHIFTDCGAQINVGFSPPLPGLAQASANSSPPSVQGQVLLQSNQSYLNGTPFATWQPLTPGGLGSWLFQLQPLSPGWPSLLADANGNLSPSVVEDIYIVCYYSAK